MFPLLKDLSFCPDLFYFFVLLSALCSSAVDWILPGIRKGRAGVETAVVYFVATSCGTMVLIDKEQLTEEDTVFGPYIKEFRFSFFVFFFQCKCVVLIVCGRKVFFFQIILTFQFNYCCVYCYLIWKSLERADDTDTLVPHMCVRETNQIETSKFQ